MIRTFHLAVLLACAGSALAQPLYKWTETDGSITFSPEKPEKGIDFQVINADAGVKPSKIAVRDTTITETEATGSDQASGTQKISYGSSDLAQPLSSSYSSVQRLDSRTIHANDLVSKAGQQASMASMSKQPSNQTSQSPEAATAAAQKQNRCDDLRKRVVSLERRLRSNLTPADMDNTVVHMSKYQKSFDRHCE